MIYPLLREFAQGGRWLGVYPQLLAVWAYNTPFSCPPLVQARAKEFVDAGLKNVCWRLHPQEWPYFAMNYDAAAEWSWNAKGRSVSEFAEAWAVRQGFKDAGKVVEWAEVLGPVAWDVHEGGFPLNLPKVTRSLGAAPLKLGEGAFQAFPTVERFEQDLNACQRAMSLAKEIASPILTAETQVMTNYVSLLKSLYQLSERLAATSEITAADRAALEKTMALFKASHSSLLDGLRAWYAAVQKERGAPPWRLDSTPKEIKENCDRIHELCAWLSAQSKGTLRVLMNGFGKPETLGGRTAFNSDETGRGDGRAGWASFNFVVKDFTKSFELHLSVWGKSDPLNLIICAEGQGKGRSEGGKWTPVEAQGMLSGQEQWDHLVYRLTPELYDRAGPRQTVGLGGGDSQIWISECWLEGK
ncbi:MAG: hypothetical protein FJ272_11135 [Planctomycetes bacterium]|nr:hypothetical protein [Planctomycetota bacterium]